MTNESQAPYLSVVKFYEHQYLHNGESYEWIRLRTSTMQDKKVRALSANAELVWYHVLQWAGYYMNAIPNDVMALARECDRRPEYVRRGLKELLNAGLLREAMRKPKRDSSEGLRKITGFRLVRGSHGIGYVDDPKGTDRPPQSFLNSIRKGR